MAEAKQYVFTYREVAEQLVKSVDIQEGYWGVYFEFGLKAANVGGPDDLIPAAVLPVLKVGIQRFDEPNNLTVDAKEVNPSRKKPAKP